MDLNKSDEQFYHILKSLRGDRRSKYDVQRLPESARMQWYAPTLVACTDRRPLCGWPRIPLSIE
jgi:hypothetical protein